MATTLERVTLAALEAGDDEPVVLTDVGARRVARALDAAVLGPGAEGDLRRLLAITVALEEDMGAPSAAAALRDLLAAHPEARRIIETRVIRSGAIDETRDFRAREGRDEGRVAPRFDGPQGDLRLRDLVDPITRRPTTSRGDLR
jgi:hypothetical protein